MSSKITLTDAIVIAKKGEDPVRYKNTALSGKRIATFSVGVKVFDASYEDSCRYNNFFIYVPNSMVDVIENMKLRQNSLVHIHASLDFTKDVLKAREGQGDEHDRNFGKSRLVNGLQLTLLDIQFAGTTNANRRKETPNEEESKEPEHKTVQVNPPDSTPARTSTDMALPDKHTDRADTTASSLVGGDIEKEKGIQIINLDEDDIFQKRERR